MDFDGNEARRWEGRDEGIAGGLEGTSFLGPSGSMRVSKENETRCLGSLPTLPVFDRNSGLPEVTANGMSEAMAGALPKYAYLVYE